MGTTVELQPWLTLQAAAAQTGPTQDMDEWVDTSNYNSAILQVEAPQVSNCTVVIESCDEVGGSFTTHIAVTAAAPGATVLYLLASQPVGSNSRMNDFVRWRIDAHPSNAWETTFRLTMVLK